MSYKPNQMDVTAGYILEKEEFDLANKDLVAQVKNFLRNFLLIWKIPDYAPLRPKLRAKLFIIGRYGHTSICKMIYSIIKEINKGRSEKARTDARSDNFSYLFEPWANLTPENKKRLTKLFLHVKYNLGDELPTILLVGQEFKQSPAYKELEVLAKVIVRKMPDADQETRLEYAPKYIQERVKRPVDSMLEVLPKGVKRRRILIVGDDGIGKTEFALRFLVSGVCYERIDIGNNADAEEEILPGADLDAVTRETKIYTYRSGDGRIIEIIDTPGFYMEDPTNRNKETVTRFYTDFSKYTEHILGLLAPNVPHLKDEDKKIHHVLFCFLRPRWKDWQYSLIKAMTEFAPVTVCRLQAVSERECDENLNLLRNCEHLKCLPAERFVKVLAKDVESNEEIIHAFGMHTLARSLGQNMFEWEQSQEHLRDLYEKNKSAYFGTIRVKAAAIVAAFTTACAGAGFIPIPFVDTAIVIPLHVGMLGAISRLFGIKAPRRVLANIANGLWTGAVANAPALVSKALFFGVELLKFIPVVNIVAMAGAAGIHAFATSVTGASFTAMLYQKALKGTLSEISLNNEKKILEKLIKLKKKNLGQIYSTNEEKENEIMEFK